MRCFCCNKLLSSSESVAKFKLSGDYTDTCNQCLRTMDVEVVRGGAVEEADFMVEDEDPSPEELLFLDSINDDE